MDRKSNVQDDYEIITIKEWMPELYRSGRDSRWVERNHDLLFEAITHGLNFEWYAQDAIEALNIIFDCIILRDDYRRWRPLLFEALKHADFLHDDEARMQIYQQLGHNYLKYGLREAATAAFEQSLAQAENTHAPEMVLRARLGLLREEGIYSRADFTQVAAELRALCRQVDDRELVAQTHSTLALAYCFRHEIPQALGHGQTAYAMWHQLKDNAHKAAVAFTLAEAYRFAGLFHWSQHYSNLGQQHLPGNNYERHTAVFAYQTGLLYLIDKRDYNTAEEWLQLALTKLAVLDYPYLTAAAHHSLGIAQTQAGKLDEAGLNLKTALCQWRHLQNKFEMGNVAHAIGFLAHRKQNGRQARRWYLRARTLLFTQPDSPARQKILADLEEDLRKLNDVA